MMTEPERTPQTAPDLEALREAEAAARWLISKPTSDDVERLDRYVSAVEARVRAEEQAASDHWRARYKELETVTSVVNDERNRLRAEVERLRPVVVAVAAASPHQVVGGEAGGRTLQDAARAALSTEESE